MHWCQLSTRLTKAGKRALLVCKALDRQRICQLIRIHELKSTTITDRISINRAILRSKATGMSLFWRLNLSETIWSPDLIWWNFISHLLRNRRSLPIIRFTANHLSISLKIMISNIQFKRAKWLARTRAEQNTINKQWSCGSATGCNKRPLMIVRWDALTRSKEIIGLQGPSGLWLHRNHRARIWPWCEKGSRSA